MKNQNFELRVNLAKKRVIYYYRSLLADEFRNMELSVSYDTKRLELWKRILRNLCVMHSLDPSDVLF